MMYEVEFVKSETGEIQKQTYSVPDWRDAAHEAFKFQHNLREKFGGTWKFTKLYVVSI